MLIPELKQEIAITAKFLERVPEDKLDWRPHPKSMTIKQLANHLAEIPSWVAGTMETEGMVMDDYVPEGHNKVEDLLNTLKTGAAEAIKALKKKILNLQIRPGKWKWVVLPFLNYLNYKC